jgi:hypothetical protein
MQDAGSSAGTAHHAHRTIRVALGEAKRRGHVATNVAEIAKAPRLEEEDIEPFTIEEVQSLLFHIWKKLLGDAGIRDGRLHDARHTAATVLLILGVPDVVDATTGWERGRSLSKSATLSGSRSGPTEGLCGAVRAWGFLCPLREELIEQREENRDDTFFLLRRELPVIPTFIGEGDVTDQAHPSVLAFPAAPGHQPVTPAVEPGAAVPPSVGVVADQEAFHAGECGLTHEGLGALGHEGPVLTLTHVYEAHPLILPHRSRLSPTPSEQRAAN